MMPSSAPCFALLARPDWGNRFLAYRKPVCEIKGDWAEWGKIREELYKRRGSQNMSHGAAVGYFTYEGDFHFLFFDAGEVSELKTLDVSMAPSSHECGEADWRCNMCREDYLAKVERVREWIAAGDIYQVNLARALCKEVGPMDGELFLRALWTVSRAPYLAMVRSEDRTVYSASPELFLEIVDGAICTRPIKGTRPRSQDLVEDARLMEELVTSGKERAELLMITDLERNDLGRVCEYGSVEVPELVRVQSLSHVHHLYSTVRGKLRAGVDALEAVRACFPGGSITGAPKKRAKEIIRELEPEPRGVYTGAVGYFGYDGSARFSIAIRTGVWSGGVFRFGVGSGITWDSDAQSEYEETEHKARVMLDAWSLCEEAMLRRIL